LKGIKENINKIEERFVIGEIDGSLYQNMQRNTRMKKKESNKKFKKTV